MLTIPAEQLRLLSIDAELVGDIMFRHRAVLYQAWERRLLPKKMAKQKHDFTARLVASTATVVEPCRGRHNGHSPQAH